MRTGQTTELGAGGTGSGRIDRIERRIEIAGPRDAEQRSRLVEITQECSVHEPWRGRSGARPASPIDARLSRWMQKVSPQRLGRREEMIEVSTGSMLCYCR